MSHCSTDWAPTEDRYGWETSLRVRTWHQNTAPNEGQQLIPPNQVAPQHFVPVPEHCCMETREGGSVPMALSEGRVTGLLIASASQSWPWEGRTRHTKPRVQTHISYSTSSTSSWRHGVYKGAGAGCLQKLGLPKTQCIKVFMWAPSCYCRTSNIPRTTEQE